MRFPLLTAPLLLVALTAHGANLEVARAPEPGTAIREDLHEDQLPHSRAAVGTGTIARAYLSSPTGRYAHGVLGDRIEGVHLGPGRELESSARCQMLNAK